MSAIPRLVAAISVSLLLTAPSALAWNLSQEPSSLPAPIAAWTTDLLPQAANVHGAKQSAACALGDVNGDGVHDLLVRVRAAPSSPPQLLALAGPDLQTPIWQVATKAERVLQCAPDLDRDGLSDPVTVVANAQAAGSAAAGQSVDRAMQVIDGATGDILIKRQHKAMGQGAKAGTVSASSNTTADLMPAAAGAEAFIKTEVQRSILTGLPAALPVDQVTTTARRAAQLDLLSATGTVEGVIRIDQPGVDPLAMAPIPVGQGLPDVGVLTAKTASPVQEATQRVPMLSRYNPDGTLAWARELEATQALPMLVPRAGDLDLDGVQDMVVENVPVGVAAGATSQFQVLSGIDGRTLFQSGAPVMGLAAALPLGMLPSGQPALLSATQATQSSKLTLAALDGAGAVVWTLDVDAGSIPINVRPDAYTGDPLGFTDLTGDGVPDVGVASRKGSDLAITAINGATGAISWTQTLADVDRVVAAPRTNLGQIHSTAATVPSDLFAIQNMSKGVGLGLVMGATGKIIWTVRGAIPAVADADLELDAAGDLNKDGVQDVIATVSARVGGRLAQDAEESSPNQTGSGAAAYALSGADGSTLWSNSTDGSGTAPTLDAQRGEGFEERAEELEATQEKGRAPGLALVIVIAVLGTLALRRRRR
jgi:hypothetical protein